MAKPPELDQGFLRNERPVGTIEPGTLPPERADVTIVIPTNFRWTSGEGVYGPMPLLLHDLAVRLGRELPAAACDVIILDDTNPPDRPLIAACVTAALDEVAGAPPVYLVGVPEREALHAMLDERLPPDVDREILRFLVTRWGYGPQRVRGDTAASGSPILLSFDDDLRARELITASDDWLHANDIEEVPDSFVYAPRRDFDDHSMFRIVPSEQLRPYMRVLGRTAAEIRRDSPGIHFTTCTRNTKDSGLSRSMMDDTRPAQYVTTHDGTSFDPGAGDIVGVATGRKRSVPDVNAGMLLDYYIAAGLKTGGALRFRAIPSGPHGSFVTARDTNPDCAVMGRMMSSASVAKIPWLLSSPDISARHGLVVGPYRAEDRLFTQPPSEGVLLAGVPAIFKHVRSEVGFRPDLLASFWSELLGDTLGDLVLEILVDDRTTHRFSIPRDGVKAPAAGVVERIRETALAKASSMRDRMRTAATDGGADPRARERFLSSLHDLLEDLVHQCEPDLETFRRKVDAEITEQLDFVRRTLDVYYTLMDASRDLRSGGAYPAGRFRAPP